MRREKKWHRFARWTCGLSQRRLSAWPVQADGDCLPRTLLWGVGAADTKEARLAERAKLSAFVQAQASSPPFCAAWASALQGLEALSAPTLALASAAEGAPEGGPRDARSKRSRSTTPPWASLRGFLTAFRASGALSGGAPAWPPLPRT